VFHDILILNDYGKMKFPKILNIVLLIATICFPLNILFYVNILSLIKDQDFLLSMITTDLSQKISEKKENLKKQEDVILNISNMKKDLENQKIIILSNFLIITTIVLSMFFHRIHNNKHLK
jgi:hypothetical protein